MERIIISVALFAVGAFAVYKMVSVKPHNLVKKDNFAVSFPDDIPDDRPGKEVDCFYAQKTALIPAVILLCGVVFFLFLAFYENPAYGVDCLSAIPCAAFINDATRRVVICENAIIEKSWFRGKTFYLRDVSRLESYNIISALSYRGVSYGYRFMRGEDVLFKMKVNEYKDLDRIEKLFEEWN